MIDFSTVVQLDSEFHVENAGVEISLTELAPMGDCFHDFGRNDPELLCILAEDGLI
jgi:hypothetical protein